jgi:ribosomal protein S18 acetylase RimI-like enzyme
MIEVVALPVDGDKTTWEVRRDGRALGTAVTGVRRSGPLLTGLDVPLDAASSALDALLDTVRDEGEDSLIVDVAPGDPVLEAALHGRDALLVATQMLLDLAAPVSPPPRVTLRPMTAAEFAGYRDQLVTAYAQDMLDAGAFADPAAALAASEQSTMDLLPEGVDTSGQHLWTAYDGHTSDRTPVGILWIAVDGPKAFIYDIEVRAEQRRRGYGQEMLDAGAVAAVELGARTLGLNVFGHNDGARALYERAGYTTTERSYRIEL